MEIKEFSDSSKIWIFQANQPLLPEMMSTIDQVLSDFCENWTSHGAQMKAGFTIEYNRFVVVALDESTAVVSGCGQDKLIHVIQNLGTTLKLDFFDRLQVVYFEENILKEVRLHEFWGLRKANIITNETKVFDNTVKNLGEWKEKWVVSFDNSWHAEMWGK
jgi:hypothetical protein